MKRLQNITEVLSIKILLILILVGITSFLTMEFVLKMEPCRLCILQRIPYYTAFMICILFLFKFLKGKFAILLILFCFVVASGIAGFHFLVEEKIVGFSCQKVLNAQTIEDLKNEIYNSAPSCDIKVKVFGIRIILLSLIYNLMIVILCYIMYKTILN